MQNKLDRKTAAAEEAESWERGEKGKGKGREEGKEKAKGVLLSTPEGGEAAVFLNQIQTAHTCTWCSLFIVLEHNWGNNRPPMVGPFVREILEKRASFSLLGVVNHRAIFTNHDFDCMRKC